MAPVLDSTSYPHLWERIISYAGYDLLLRLRRVDRASNAVATTALFSHVIVSRHIRGKGYLPILLSSPSRRRLPVAPLDMDYPPHEGWAATRTLDVELGEETRYLDWIPEDLFPNLETVRRAGYTEYAPEAHTYVDALHMPPELDADPFIDDVGDKTRRHVIVVMYDPAWKGLAGDTFMNIDFCQEGVAGVFVFVPSPSGAGGGRAGAHLDPLSATPCFLTEGADGVDGEVDEEESGEEGEDDDDEDVGSGDGDGYASTNDSTSDREEREVTFLDQFFWCAAQRMHKTCVFAGLEGVSPALLAKEFQLDLELVAARARGPKDQWAAFVREHALDAIRAIDCEPESDAEVDNRAVEEVVEVMTMDAFRARVGEEAFMRETFGETRAGVL